MKSKTYLAGDRILNSYYLFQLGNRHKNPKSHILSHSEGPILIIVGI